MLAVRVEQEPLSDEERVSVLSLHLFIGKLKHSLSQIFQDFDLYEFIIKLYFNTLHAFPLFYSPFFPLLHHLAQAAMAKIESNVWLFIVQ